MKQSNYAYKNPHKKTHTLQARLNNESNDKFNQLKEVHDIKQDTAMIEELIDSKHSDLGLDARNSEAELKGVK